MKTTKDLLRRVLEFVLLAAVALVFLAVIQIYTGALTPKPNASGNGNGYPPPEEKKIAVSTDSGLPYPPPVNTPTLAPTLTQGPPEPTITEAMPPTEPVKPTLAPWPTATFRPGPTQTLIPTHPPVSDASGQILYVQGDITVTYKALGVNARGEVTVPPSTVINHPIDIVGTVFYSPDGSRSAVIGEWAAGFTVDINTQKIEPLDIPGRPEAIFAWYPDSQQTLVRTNGRSLWLYNVFSKEYTVLAQPLYETIDGAASSPDGRMIIFSKIIQSSGTAEIWIINPDGRNAHSLFTLKSGAHLFSWSPDGKRIAFWGKGLTVMNADGSDLRQIAEDLLSPGCYKLPPVWSPDSRTMLVVTSSTNMACRWGKEAFDGANISLVDIESGKARPILPDGSPGNLDPSWSPDGSQIVFVSNRDGKYGLWTVQADGSSLRLLVESDDLIRYPFWKRN